VDKCKPLNVGASGGDLKLTGGGSASTAGCDVGMYTCAGQLVSAVVYRAVLKGCSRINFGSEAGAYTRPHLSST